MCVSVDCGVCVCVCVSYWVGMLGDPTGRGVCVWKAWGVCVCVCVGGWGSCGVLKELK